MKRIVLGLAVLLAFAVGLTVRFVPDLFAADPTLRNFPDKFETKILDPETGWGGRNLDSLGGMLAALHAEVQDAHRRVACDGGLPVATKTALTALLKADLAIAVADADCPILYVTAKDDGATFPRR